MCKQPGCPCKDARIVSTRTAKLVRYVHPEAAPVRTGLEPLPADWPAWPDRIAPDAGFPIAAVLTRSGPWPYDETAQ